MSRKSDNQDGVRYSIATKMLVAFLVITIGSISFTGYLAYSTVSAIGEHSLSSSREVGDAATTDAVNALTDLGEQMIREKARDVAMEMEAYMRSHPNMTIADLQNDSYFSSIAVQPVGETGYTVVLDLDTGIYYFHKRPDLVGYDSHGFKDTLPEAWELINHTITYKEEYGGYFQWIEADGSIRDKYTYFAIVNATTSDGKRMFVAATTYIDEFYEPMKQTEEKIDEATSASQSNIRNQITSNLYIFVVFLLLFTGIASIVSYVISSAVTNPILELTDAVNRAKGGDLDARVSIENSDEIGVLARHFNEMIAEIQKNRKALEMELERKKKALEKVNRELDEIESVLSGSEVAEEVENIVSNEFFQHLKKNIEHIRYGHKEQAGGTGE